MALRLLDSSAMNFTKASFVLLVPLVACVHSTTEDVPPCRRDALVVGTANGTLAISRKGNAWSQQNMQGMSWISQVAPLGHDVLVTGVMDTNAIARVDLATQTVVQTVPDVGPVLVAPAGILDHETGRLAPVTASGIATFADHGPAFLDGSVDGNRVVLLASEAAAGPHGALSSVIVSNDGGATFERAVELPTVTVRD